MSDQPPPAVPPLGPADPPGPPAGHPDPSGPHPDESGTSARHPGTSAPAGPHPGGPGGDPTLPSPWAGPGDRPAWDPTAPAGQPGAQTGPPGQPGAQTGGYSPPPGQPGAQPGWDPGVAPGQPGAYAGWDPAVPPAQAGAPGGWDPSAPPGWGPPSGTQPGWPYPPGTYPPGTYPPAGYPPGAAPYPGQPWYPGAPVAGWYPPGLDPADRLVTPPGAGLGGWFERCVGAARRGWRPLLPILLLTQVLPAAVLSVLSLGVDPTAGWEASTAADPAALPDTFVSDLATVFAVLIGGSLLIGLVQAVGWAAGTWVITRQAAGAPVDVGTALRYGLRRALGLWGWSLLSGVIVGLGVCFCVIPGIYFAFALSMAGPVYLFERDNPIGRSFRMFHQRLGLVLGRVALVVAAVIVGSLVPGVLEGVGSAPFGTDPLSAPGSAAGVVVVIAVTAVLALPAHLVQLVGLVVTYAEQRSHEGPVNSAGLAGELG